MLKAIYEELKFIYRILNESDYQLLAQSLSYYSVFAIVPLAACFLMVFESFGGVFRFEQNFLPQLLDFLSMGAGEAVVKQGIQSSLDRVNNGTVGATSALLFFFIANILLFKIDKAIQKIWSIRQNRKMRNRLVGQMLILTAGPVSLSVLLGLSSAAAGTFNVNLISQVLSYLILFGTLFLIYQFGPRAKVKLHAALIASFLVLMCLFGVKEIFWFMARNVFSYNKIYGTLAVLPLFLFWIYTLWNIFLGGVVLSYRLSVSKKSFFTKNQTKS